VNKNTFVLIDGNAILHRAYHAMPRFEVSGKLVNAIYGFISILFSAIEKHEPEYLAVAFDVKGPTFRDELFKEYKAKRIKPPQEFYDQIPDVWEFLRVAEIPIMSKEGYEADDIIGTLAKKVNGDLGEGEVIIITGDQDTLQLVDDRTKVAMPATAARVSVPASTSVLYGGESNPSTVIDLWNIPDGDVKEIYSLNLNDSTVRSQWVDLIRNSYGAFKGIKHDDMGMSDQKILCPTCATRANLPDNYFSQMYPVYAQKYNNDFLITGRLDWFSVGTDNQNAQGWVGLSRLGGPVEYNGYQIKHFLDSALTQVASGYPHPLLEPDFDVVSMSGTKIPRNQKEFVRTMQLQTFMPVMNQSLGFWHLTDQNDVNRVIFASQLKQRLQQYTYDQAQKWYETGIPYTVQPLYVNYPNDETAYGLYGYAGNDRQTPWNEYMFGNALLVRPIFTDNDTFQVYLPGGATTRWRYLLTSGKSAEQGGRTISYTGTINDFPVFLKEGEILIIGDADTTKDTLYAYVFLESAGKTQSSVYSVHKNGTVYKLQAVKDGEVYKLKNTATNQWVIMTDDHYNKGFRIAEITSLLHNSIPGDLNTDGHVNIFDYNLLVSKFNNPYTIFDYNSLVANFGK